MSKQTSLQDFEAVAQHITLPIGLTIDRLTIVTGGATAETDPFQVTLKDPGTVKVELGQTNLANYLNKIKPGPMRNFRVECRDEHIFIEAMARILLDVPVKAQCKLAIIDDERLNVVLVDADVVGIDSDRLVRSQIEKFNPVFDVCDLPFALVLDSVTIDDGFVTILGRATL